MHRKMQFSFNVNIYGLLYSGTHMPYGNGFIGSCVAGFHWTNFAILIYFASTQEHNPSPSFGDMPSSLRPGMYTTARVTRHLWRPHSWKLQCNRHIRLWGNMLMNSGEIYKYQNLSLPGAPFEASNINNFPVRWITDFTVFDVKVIQFVIVMSLYKPTVKQQFTTHTSFVRHIGPLEMRL